jgi:hypothetical protein
MASISAAFVDLSTIDNVEKNVLYGGSDTLDSQLYRDFRPCFWFTQFISESKITSQAPDASYTMSRQVDATFYSFVRITLPTITVQEQYATTIRIALTFNAANNFINKGNISFSDLPVSPFDSVVMDNTSELLTRAGRYKAMCKTQGNTIDKVNFSTTIPGDVLTAFLPMWYDNAEGVPLLNLLCTGNSVCVNLSTISTYDQLVKIQQLDATTNTWNNLLPNTVQQYCSITGNSWNVLTPKLINCHAICTDTERSLIQEIAGNMPIQQWASYSSKSEKLTDQQLTLKFYGPVRALTFNVLNQTAAQYNWYSNYTTQPFDPENGVDPVSTVTLMYDTLPKYDKVRSDIFSEILPARHAVRVPQSAGYHLIPYCRKLESYDPDGSTDYSNISPELNLTMVDASLDPLSCNYTIEVRALGFTVVNFSEEVITFPTF